MIKNLPVLKRFDWVLIGAVAALCVTSLLTLYSENFGKSSFSFFERQILFILLGFLVMFAISYFDFSVFRNFPYLLLIFYFLGLVALALLLFLGLAVKGASSWFNIGGLGFEPSELMKLVIIMLLAKYFSLRHVEMYRARHVLVSGFYVLLPLVLILVQPDLGSAAVLLAIWVGLILLTGIKLRHFFLVLLCFALFFSAAWFGALKPYQKERLITFVNPQKDPLGASYNLIQSRIAIGSGGFFGTGLGKGSQARLDFLPEKQSDFIFAAFAEEWGFVGVIILIGLFGVIFYRLINISMRSESNFFRILSAGICVMIFVQVFINIGVALGILPVTGINLPFVSYGGSNLLTNFIALGIVQSIYARNK